HGINLRRQSVVAHRAHRAMGHPGAYEDCGLDVGDDTKYAVLYLAITQSGQVPVYSCGAPEAVRDLRVSEALLDGLSLSGILEVSYAARTAFSRKKPCRRR